MAMYLQCLIGLCMILMVHSNCERNSSHPIPPVNEEIGDVTLDVDLMNYRATIKCTNNSQLQFVNFNFSFNNPPCPKWENHSYFGIENCNIRDHVDLANMLNNNETVTSELRIANSPDEIILSENNLQHFKGITTFRLHSNNNVTLSPDALSRISYIQALSITNNSNLFLTRSTIKTLKTLIIKNNEHIELSQDAFEGMRNLTYLDLKNNNLASIHENLFQATINLSELDLSHNLLTVFDNGTFTSLSRLEKLDLQHNNLSDIPLKSFEALTNLKTLDLSNNNLRSIHDPIFKDLSNLRSLNLSNNLLEELSPKSFEGLYLLTTLRLSHNNLTMLDENIFLGTSYLEELFLNDNKLEKLPDSFGKESVLSTIQLQNNLLQSLPKTFFDHVHIFSEVDARNNNFTDRYNYLLNFRMIFWGPYVEFDDRLYFNSWNETREFLKKENK